MDIIKHKNSNEVISSFPHYGKDSTSRYGYFVLVKELVYFFYVEHGEQPVEIEYYEVTDEYEVFKDVIKYSYLWYELHPCCKDNVEFPAYALSYLINGDASGINENEKEEVDEWLEDWNKKNNEENKSVILIPEEEQNFCTYPAFGLPCNTVEVGIWIL